MAKKLSDIPVSVLDLATIVEGDTASDAFRKSLESAQHAERLGFTRYWFAEHHNMESVASAATAVLIGYIAGGTSTIRVGSGGIMLPNHAPLIIAEQFGTLASLYPGRIDLGVGRAPGTDPLTSWALRRERKGDVDEFPNDVVELMNYLGPKQPEAKVHAVPGQNTNVPVWILGSSTYGAQLAAMLGLPYAFASHFAPTYLMDALQVYRDRFKPSQHLQQPYSMACVNVIAADTDEEAQRLATSLYMLALGLIKDKRRPLQPPVASMEDLWSTQEQAAVEHMMHYRFVGSRATVKEELEKFVAATGVDELMIAAHIYDQAARIKSMEIVADIFKNQG
ncbi:LLM class flavin-dependent oxidoreductase [Aridibaculum aurantiacum]|uniref:LLM class flavin-dependent oxidoreductase n=1 Tax=Aridibaculum aurantiacum TaxID=2810307 RepID=UPI001A960473|nr:LLM class flavin-dependent oxidoreductase [Aridibaculum aurantiacum]